MKQLTLVLLLATLINILAGQSQSLKTVNDVIAQIEFKEDTVKSVFDWVTANIRYDTKVITKPKSFAKKRGKDEEARLKRVLLTKRGVCQHYAELTDTILKTLGFNSYVVPGYVRSPTTGKLSSVGHAWNAVEVNDKWILLDSTWGAGVVTNNKRYRSKYNPFFYNTSPQKLIKSHMPYDPIWQLLEKPIDYQTFDKNKINAELLAAAKNFSPIEDYLNKIRVDQLEDELNRSKQLGTANKLVKSYYKTVDNNQAVFQFNEIAALYNKTVEEYNTYVAAQKINSAGDYNKNHIQQWVDNMNQVIKACESIKVSDPKKKLSLKNNLKNAKSFKINLEKVLLRFN